MCVWMLTSVWYLSFEMGFFKVNCTILGANISGLKGLQQATSFMDKQFPFL